MSRVHTILLMTVCAALSAGCSSMSVRTDYDVEADFETYSSFAWLEAKEPGPRQPRPSPLVEQRITRGVTEVLQTRGYREAPRRTADLLVTYHTAVRHKVYVSHVGYGYPHRWRWGWGWGTSRVHHYREGSLVIDIIDRRTRGLVWRGVAEGALTSPDPSDEKVRKVVARVLADFPPQP